MQLPVWGKLPSLVSVKPYNKKAKVHTSRTIELNRESLNNVYGVLPKKHAAAESFT